MKVRIHLLCIVFCLCSGCSPDLLNTIPPPVEYTPPEVSKFKLSNGIQVYFLEDRELPLVRGTLYLPKGSLWENPSELGGVSAMGSLLRAGGTRKLSAEALDQKLENLSAKITTSYAGESGSVSFGCLSGDLDKVLDLTFDVIHNPRFEEDRLSLWKSQAIEGIRRRQDSPESIADITLTKLLYGDSVFGRVLQVQDIERISRPFLYEIHSRFVRPHNAILAIAGNISQPELNNLLEKRFGNWQNTRPAPEGLPKVDVPPATGLYFIEKPFSQATVLVAQRGPARLPEDYPAVDSFNMIFGSDGDFGSRLVQRVRTSRGLAYSLMGGIYSGFITGKNMIALQTKAESAGDAFEQSLDVLKELQSELVPSGELTEAQGGAINSFVFKFDSSDDLVQRYALLELLKYPKSYDETYIGKLTDVTSEEIRATAKKYWDVDKMVVVVVGNKSAKASIASTWKRLFPKGKMQEITFSY